VASAPHTDLPLLHLTGIITTPSYPEANLVKICSGCHNH
jgi:hypothetical protein